MKATHYRGKIDGDIKQYLKKKHSNGAVAPSFIGYEPFKQLWDMGVMIPQIASIRLVYGFGEDEHYVVIDENLVEGIELKLYSGKPGQHNTKKLLTNTKKKFLFWEPSGLDPKVFR